MTDAPRLAIAAARQLFAIFTLPRHVRKFYLRALATALRTRDGFSLRSVTYPRELSELLKLARGRRHVVEIGTGTAWSAIALALADEGREVVKYDPYPMRARERYLNLIGDAGVRIQLRGEPGERGPQEDILVDFLFIDSGHKREETIATFRVWEPAVAPNGIVVFHDYNSRTWPEVTEAITELGLEGEPRGFLFVWRKRAVGPPGS